MAVQKTITTTTDSITITFYNFTSQTYNRYVSYYINGNYDGMLTLASGKTSVTYSFEYLSPGTTYTISAELSGSSGNIIASYGPYYITTDAEISYPTGDYGSCSTSDITFNSITVNLSYITQRDYDRTVFFYWYNTSTGTKGSSSLMLSAYSTSLSRVMSGLTSGVRYRFYVKVLNPDGTTNYESDYFYATTADTNYTLSLTTSATSNSVSVTVTLNVIKSYDVDCTVYLDDERALEAVISAGSLSRTITWTTNIIPATFYKITLKDNIRNLSWDTNRRTKNNFVWIPSVSSGAQFNIKAGNSDGSTSGSWNDFTKQLSKKCDDYSLAGTYSFTTAVKGNQFKASMFNQAVNAINGLVDMNSGDCKTKMSKVSSGDKIMAADINQLAACLNE